MLAARHRESLPVDARLERPVDGLEEVVAVVLRVEPDQVGAQHAGQQLGLPGADAEGLEVRPRDVPEDRHARVGALGLDERRQRREVIVLDEDQRRFGVLDLVQHRVGELAVHLQVVSPVVRPEDRARVHDVAQRPQALVGEAGVVSLLLLLGEPHPAQRVARVVDGHAEPAARIGGLTVGVATGVRDPHPAARAHDRIHRRHQTAGRRLRVDLAAPPHMAHRLAVRDDDQQPAGKLLADELLQPRLGPHALAGQAQRRLLLRGGLGALHAAREARDLEGERPEQVGVGDVGRRHRAPAAERARPLRDLGHRPRDAHLHHERGDDRDDRGEHEEPDRAVTPPVPLDLVQMRSVEEHRDRTHRLVVVDERRRVHEPVDVAEHAEALGREVARDGVGHLGQRRR